jgi:hypothetical protein
VGVFYLFSAMAARSLGSTDFGSMRAIGWAFACCFAAITVVSWRYLLSYCPTYGFLNPDYAVFDFSCLAFGEVARAFAAP